jgi:ATP-dependent Clp protease ATP-binding subunit ClpC
MLGFERFDGGAQEVATRSIAIMQRYRHTQLDTDHVLEAILEQVDSVVMDVLKELKVDTNQLRSQIDQLLKSNPHLAAQIPVMQAAQVYITPRVKVIMDRSNEEATRLKAQTISIDHIMLAILSEQGTETSRILMEAGVTHDRFLEVLMSFSAGHSTTTKTKSEPRMRTLEKYSRDLTQLARDGKLDPVIGRDQEIMRVLQVLSRRTKNNPVLIGEAGVGKTAIVEGLALKIAAGDVPEPLLNKRLISLDLGAMVGCVQCASSILISAK